jgi:hypothetical protein
MKFTLCCTLLFGGIAHADINDMVNAAMWRKQPDAARKLNLPKTPQSGINGMATRAAEAAIKNPAPATPRRSFRAWLKGK